MVKRTKTSVSAALDRIERSICLERAGHRCQRCQTAWKPQWCHIVKRGRKALRWHRSNGLILCGAVEPGDDRTYSCHYWFDNLITDRQRVKFVESVKPGAYDMLEASILHNFELSLDEMLQLVEMKKTELKGYTDINERTKRAATRCRNCHA